MNAEALKEKNIDQLKQHLEELLREQFNLRMQKGMGEMPRPHQFKKVRRDIARVKTVISQKEREA